MIRLQHIILCVLRAWTLVAWLTANPCLAETVDTRSADTSSQDLDEWLGTAASLNRPTMTDAAGSHGSFGMDFGAGVSRFSTNSKNQITKTELGGNTDASGSSSVNVPKFWISKGTMLPLDFTLTGGSTPDRSFASLGGIVQLTVFEARSWPAVSLRGFYGRSLNNNNTAVSSSGGELAVSYGFFRYFNGYLTAGRSDHRAAFTFDSDRTNAISLHDDQKGDVYTREWQEPSRAAGLKITIIPGRLSATVETTSFKTDEDAFNIRLTAFL